MVREEYIEHDHNRGCRASHRRMLSNRVFVPSGGPLAHEHEDCGIEPVFGRSALEIRHSFNGADRVLVDASDDHAQAIELFSQSVAGSVRGTLRSIRKKCTRGWSCSCGRKGPGCCWAR